MVDDKKVVVDPSAGTPTPEDLAKKVLDQDRSLYAPTLPSSLEGGAALDALAATKSQENEEAAEAARKQAEADEAKAKADAEAAAAAAANPEAAAAAAAKAKEEAAAAEKARLAAIPPDRFADVQLPPGTRGRSAEAFASIKLRAAQEISDISKKAEELEKRLKEAEAKAQNPVPPELEKELAELRSFRAKLDVESDPKWKEFDAQANKTADFIYSQLKQHGSVVDDKTIEEIKKLGGPLGVNMKKILDAIGDPTTERIVLAKMADLAQNKFEKDQAVQAAKGNADEYLKQRSEEANKSATQHTDATRNEMVSLTQKLDWLLPRAPKPDATEDQKKAIAEHNKWLEETNQQLAAALSDDSPQMRAILLTGMAQLFYTQRSHTIFKAEQAAKVAGLEKQLAEATDTLERYKRASTTRLREIVPASQIPAQKQEVNPNLTAAESLDKLRDQVMAARQAAGGAS